MYWLPIFSAIFAISVARDLRTATDGDLGREDGAEDTYKRLAYVGEEKSAISEGKSDSGLEKNSEEIAINFAVSDENNGTEGIKTLNDTQRTARQVFTPGAAQFFTVPTQTVPWNPPMFAQNGGGSQFQTVPTINAPFGFPGAPQFNQQQGGFQVPQPSPQFGQAPAPFAFQPQAQQQTQMRQFGPGGPLVSQQGGFTTVPTQFGPMQQFPGMQGQGQFGTPVQQFPSGQGPSQFGPQFQQFPSMQGPGQFGPQVQQFRNMQGAGQFAAPMQQQFPSTQGPGQFGAPIQLLTNLQPNPFQPQQQFPQGPTFATVPMVQPQQQQQPFFQPGPAFQQQPLQQFFQPGPVFTPQQPQEFGFGPGQFFPPSSGAPQFIQQPEPFPQPFFTPLQGQQQFPGPQFVPQQQGPEFVPPSFIAGPPAFSPGGPEFAPSFFPGTPSVFTAPPSQPPQFFAGQSGGFSPQGPSFGATSGTFSQNGFMPGGGSLLSSFSSSSGPSFGTSGAPVFFSRDAVPSANSGSTSPASNFSSVSINQISEAAKDSEESSGRTTRTDDSHYKTKKAKASPARSSDAVVRHSVSESTSTSHEGKPTQTKPLPQAPAPTSTIRSHDATMTHQTVGTLSQPTEDPPQHSSMKTLQYSVPTTTVASPHPLQQSLPKFLLQSADVPPQQGLSQQQQQNLRKNTAQSRVSPDQSMPKLSDSFSPHHSGASIDSDGKYSYETAEGSRVSASDASDTSGVRKTGLRIQSHRFKVSNLSSGSRST